MKKTTEMTFEKARAYTKANRAELNAKYAAAPETDGGNPGRFAGRGFAVVKDYINKNGRPRVDDPKEVVSIRLPASVVESLRSTGRGWQTRMGDYIVNGVNHGALVVK
jgi:uncharacterized protein (DUF4415 family)